MVRGETRRVGHGDGLGDGTGWHPDSPGLLIRPTRRLLFQRRRSLEDAVYVTDGRINVSNSYYTTHSDMLSTNFLRSTMTTASGLTRVLEFDTSPDRRNLILHKVEPSGCRRFALTCRYMDPARMATDEERRNVMLHIWVWRVERDV